MASANPPWRLAGNRTIGSVTCSLATSTPIGGRPSWSLGFAEGVIEMALDTLVLEIEGLPTGHELHGEGSRISC